MRPPTRALCMYCGGTPVEAADLPPVRMQLEDGVRACPSCKLLVPPAHPSCRQCGAVPVRLTFDARVDEARKTSLLASLGEEMTETGVELLFEMVGEALVALPFEIDWS
ncbi:MAG: hypothetical protein AAFU79_36720 [Myxococcota bacterium]